jgi:ABC-type sugar transport system permease subunit
VAKIAVIVVTVWKNVSWVALIYLAGLKALPPDVFEAAAVDGARTWQRFWFITLPMLHTTTLLVVLLRAIGEVQTFEQIFGLSRGGPGSATQVIALYGYQRFFQEYRYGYGSAVNMLLFALTALVGGLLAWRLYRASQ